MRGRAANLAFTRGFSPHYIFLLMPSAYIVDAVRTPIGKFGGALSSVRPDDLAALVLRELLDRKSVV